MKKFVSNRVFFARKRTSFTQIFLREAPRPHPSSTSSTVFWHYVEKKRRNKEVQTNSRIKKWLVKPYNLPPPPFFFVFACWNLRSEVRTPPPPPSWKKKFWIGACMHSTQFFQDWFSHGQRWPFISWVSADHYKLSFRLWQPAVAEWLSSWLAEQEDRGSIPGLATWIFRDWLSPASKSRYGWKIAKSTLILKTTNQTS